MKNYLPERISAYDKSKRMDQKPSRSVGIYFI